MRQPLAPGAGAGAATGLAAAPLLSFFGGSSLASGNGGFAGPLWCRRRGFDPPPLARPGATAFGAGLAVTFAAGLAATFAAAFGAGLATTLWRPFGDRFWQLPWRPFTAGLAATLPLRQLWGGFGATLVLPAASLLYGGSLCYRLRCYFALFAALAVGFAAGLAAVLAFACGLADFGFATDLRFRRGLGLGNFGDRFRFSFLPCLKGSGCVRSVSCRRVSGRAAPSWRDSFGVSTARTPPHVSGEQGEVVEGNPLFYQRRASSLSIHHGGDASAGPFRHRRRQAPDFDRALMVIRRHAAHTSLRLTLVFNWAVAEIASKSTLKPICGGSPY